MTTSIAIIIATVVSNFLTQIVKPAKYQNMTEEEIAARKVVVRGLNAAIGLVTLIVSYIWLGEDLNPDQVSTYVEVITGAVLTYFSSQHVYRSFTKREG